MQRRFVIDTLENEGLDCRHVAVDFAHPTGFQLKSRADDGSDPRVEYFRRGSAASHMSVQSINSELLNARHLHATGITPALSAIRSSIPPARSRWRIGCTTST